MTGKELQRTVKEMGDFFLFFGEVYLAEYKVGFWEDIHTQEIVPVLPLRHAIIEDLSLIPKFKM